MTCAGWHLCVEQLDALLERFGQPAVWERALKCPCRSLRTGGADVTCVICAGTGWLWENPTECVVAIQAMKLTRQWAQETEWLSGDCLVTMPSSSEAYGIGEYDRLTLPRSTVRVNHVLVRGTQDTLPFRSIKSIDHVWAILGGVQVTLVEGIDFTRSGHAISWMSTTVPVGEHYSVLYTAQSEYFVYRDLVPTRVLGGTPMPKKVQVRLMDLMERAVSS